MNIIRAILRKDYESATRAIHENLNRKVKARLEEEKRSLAEDGTNPDSSGKFRDEVATCPKCKAKYPYATLQGVSHMGGTECPDCGVKVVRTGKQGTFQWDKDETIATYLHESKGCDSCEMLRINGVVTHETGCPKATHECKGCNEQIPKNQKYCSDCR